MLRQSTKKMTISSKILQYAILSASILSLIPTFSLAADVMPASTNSPSIRLFVESGGQRANILGHNWAELSFERKIKLIESARQGALRLGAVMALPAESYIRELDMMFAKNPSLRHIEVGQAIQGIAISLKDWDTGTGSPVAK
ncbi:MAG: hypothetical protein ACI9CF_000111 [Candidatus Omnitrophota bacterium]|jgi:hypothetical protein